MIPVDNFRPIPNNQPVGLSFTEGTAKPVSLVLDRAAALYPAYTGSIPVTGPRHLLRRGEVASQMAHNHQIVGAIPTAATNPAMRFGCEGTRPDQSIL